MFSWDCLEGWGGISNVAEGTKHENVIFSLCETFCFFTIFLPSLNHINAWQHLFRPFPVLVKRCQPVFFRLVARKAASADTVSCKAWYHLSGVDGAGEEEDGEDDEDEGFASPSSLHVQLHWQQRPRALLERPGVDARTALQGGRSGDPRRQRLAFLFLRYTFFIKEQKLSVNLCG